MLTKEITKKINAEKDCGQSVCICLIYDKSAKLYSAPMAFNNADCAKRHFKSLCSVQNFDNKDYELKYLATFSPSTGCLINDDGLIFEPGILPLDSEDENEVQEE